MLIDLYLFSALVRHPVNFLDAAHNEMVRERQVCWYYLQPCLQICFFLPNLPIAFPSYFNHMLIWLSLFQLVEQAKRLSEDIMTERIKVCFCCLTCCTKFYK